MIEQRVLGLHLVADFLEHLKERSCEAWPMFMEPLFASLKDTDSRIRTAAAYAINLIARLPPFQNSPKAPLAYQTILEILARPSPKKREPKAVLAYDNAICALASLLIHMPQHAPNADAAWKLTFDKLPLRQDVDEAKKFNKDMLKRVSNSEANVLGPNNVRLPQFIGMFSEIYSNEDQPDDDTKEAMKQFFKNLDVSLLQQMAA